MIADINIEDISFSNPLGIEFVKVSVVTAGDTLAFVNSLIVDLDIMGLTRGKATIQNLILNEPKIKLLRSNQDSTWNYEHLIKPSPPKPSAEPSKFIVDLKSFIIKSGTFIFIDSVEAQWTDKMIAYNRMLFDDLNMDMSALIQFGNNSFETNIRHLSTKEVFSGFTLDKVVASIGISPSEIKVEKLNVHTENNEFFVECSIKNFDIFGTGGNDTIEDAIFDIEIFANDFDDDEIHLFADIPIEINELDELYLKADGTLNDLNVSEANIKSNRTEFKMKANVINLIDFDAFYYIAEFERSFINTQDIRAILPDIDLSSISNITSIRTDKLIAKGNYDSTNIELSFFTNIGKIEGNAMVNWKDGLRYRSIINVNNFNALSILDNSFDNTINGSISIIGEGYDPENMSSKITMKLQRSSFNNISVRNLSLFAEIQKGGLVKIDSLKIMFDKDSTDLFFYPRTASEFIAQGFINLKNEAYGLNSEFYDIDPGRILNQKILPNNLSGRLNLSASGFDVDNIMGLANLYMESCTFYDRSMLPLELTAKSYKLPSGDKIISVESPFANLQLSGTFSIPELFSHLGNTFDQTATFFEKKFQVFTNSSIEMSESINKNTIVPVINCTIEADINDISIISGFIDNFYFDSKAKFEAKVISDSSQSIFTINKFNLEYFDLDYNGLNVEGDDIVLTGSVDADIRESNNINAVSLNLKSDSYLFISELMLDSNSVQLDFNDNKFDLYFDTKINDLLKISFTNRGEFRGNLISNKIDQLRLIYDNKFDFNNYEDIILNIDQSSFSLNNLNLQRANAEHIKADVKITDDKIDHSSLTLSNVDLNQYLYLLDETIHEQVNTLKGMIDTLEINLHGERVSPDISLRLSGNKFEFNNENLGNLESEFKLSNSNISGFLDFTEKNELINIKLKSLPASFSLTDYSFAFLSDNPLSATINVNDIPLAVVEPFLTGISDLEGKGRIQILLGGYLPDNVNYRGKLLFNDVSLMSDFNNMSYKADANLELDKTGLEIKSFVLRNRAYDLPQGQANLSGRINLENFDVKNFDLRLHSNKLKLLGNESKKVMPNIYGDLIIGTGKDPMYFTGTMERPEFTGNIELLKADLFMPQIQSGNEQQTRLIYVTKEELEESDITKEKEEMAQLGNGNGNKSFLDLLNIDVKIDLKSNLKLKMDINPTTSINADINTKENSPPIRFIKDRDKADTEFFAQLHLYDKSHLNFIKSFKTTGDINFPTGSLEQPYLDLTASYEGRSNIDNDIRKYEVRIMVKGSVEKPEISFTYFINDVEAFGDQSEIERDAIMLLLTGRTNREMSGGESTAINPGLIGEQTGLSLIETQLSKSLTEMLLNTGFVESADVNIGSGDIENVTVELSGQIDFIGDWQWAVGGNISDFTKHFITVSTPLGSLLNYDALNNVVIEMSRTVSEQISQTQDQKEWEVKIKLNNIVW